jgi:predicted nuclease with TOPRIM domain
LAFEAQLKEREERQQYEEQIAEFKDKLDRKEFFMQNKERKWLEIEKILEEYVHEDDELRDKLLELRVNVTAANTKKISNVVQENDRLKVQLDNAHEEISRLRNRLLNVDEGQVDEHEVDPLAEKKEE